MSAVHSLAGIDLNLLVVLDALLEHRSTVETARRLGRTQSAVSHALRRLREIFDDPLFLRIGRDLAPTARAQELRPMLRELLQSALAIVQQQPGDPAFLERTFRITATDYAEHVLLPRVLTLLEERAPGVRLELVATGDAAEAMLQRGEIDLGLGTGFRDVDGLLVQRLFDDRFVCVVRRDHPRIRRAPSRASYLAERHILVSPRGLPGSRVDARLEPHEQRTIVVRTPHFATAIHLAAQTDLCVTLPERFARTFSSRLPIVCFHVPVDVPPFTVQQVFRATWQTDATHTWLRALLGESADHGATLGR